MPDDSLEQQVGELIGTLKTFIDAQKECNSRLEESIDKLAISMVKAVEELTKKVDIVDAAADVAKELADKVHGKIATLYKVVGPWAPSWGRPWALSCGCWTTASRSSR